MSDLLRPLQVWPVGHPKLQQDAEGMEVPENALGGIVIAKLRAGQELKVSCIARKARAWACSIHTVTLHMCTQSIDRKSVV